METAALLKALPIKKSHGDESVAPGEMEKNLLCAKEGFEGVQVIVQIGDGFGVGGLLALHGGHDDFVAGGEFFEVGLLVRLSFFGLETLGEEVVGDGGLNGLGVGFLVHDPAGELVGVLGRIFGEFDDLLGGFLDGDVVSVHFSNDVVVIVNATRDLTVSRDGGWGEGGESAESEDGSFHNGGKLADHGERASWDLIL